VKPRTLIAPAATLVWVSLTALPATPARAETPVPFASFEGAWNFNATYNAGQVVTSNGALYISRTANNKQHAPPSTQYWSLLVPALNTQFGTNQLDHRTGDGTGAQCTLGSIMLHAGVQYPNNFLPADGTLLSVKANEALFNLFGTTYGGDGTSTFGLPDLRAAAPNNTFYLVCVAGIYP
jgi:hypothetical protein